MHNNALAFLRDFEGKVPSWFDCKKELIKNAPDFCDKVPFQVKAIAVKNAHKAFFDTLKACKISKTPANFKFKRKRSNEQSIYIPKSAITDNGIYKTLSGEGLRYKEALPETIMDSRMVYRNGKFYLLSPRKESLPVFENQENRVVSIDPGVRTFQAFYSPEHCGFIGKGDFTKINKLAIYCDSIASKRSLSKNKQKKRSLTKAILRINERIRNMIDDLHKKVALFYVKNFDIILLPTFEVSNMASKAKRKIGSKTVRAMLTWSHYKFKLFLKHKAFEYGKIVLDVNEAYTSKTHPQTGEVKNIGGAKEIKLLNGDYADRDLIGSRNILLRDLVDTPLRWDFHILGS